MGSTGKFWRRAGFAAMAVTTLMAAACGESASEGAGSTSSPQDQADASAFPVSIPSALGAADIPAVPQRVVTLGWGSDDAALALGVVPVAVQNMKSDTGTDDGILPWSRSRLRELDPAAQPTMLTASSKEIPFEQIASLRPDVILAVHSGLNQEQFDTLAAIAPTVAYPGRRWATSWEDQITTVGKALGRSERAQDLVTQSRELLTEVKAQHPEFAGKTAAFGSATEAGSYNFYFDTDPRLTLLESLGFDADPLARQLREGSDQTKFSAPVSLELLPNHDPDVLVAWYLSPELRSGIESNPLFAGLGAVGGNSYVPLTDPPLVFASSSPNVLSIPWLLDQLVPRLSEAAANVPVG
ncbi:periplasmic binding family protein [Rhodococcus sp. MTM3W5.2]|uniref:iron-siderophore ABC transporter substrate-binding protein n=1 Tax=Rhodococcus sp. MTM3W5.2 TaxID=1805827 RepID=UPI0009791FBA|nr:iron-siderophore ABC transporter substrate-binding protein [Rhodococcus sp. MTM3W5.2]AQA21019.1 periplasmic binding family protein [Rhodococcus sp. MTM3W5.2]